MSLLFKKQKYEGFSLIEIILTLGIFLIIVTSLSISHIDSLRAISNGENKNAAYMKLAEISGLLIQSKSDDWNTIILNTDSTPKYISLANGTIELVDGTSTEDGVTTWLEISPLFRDVNGNITFSGGINDPYSRIVTVYMQWVDPLGKDNYIVKEMYVNDWNTARWMVTTTPEYTLGNFTNTVIADIGDGAVGLETLLYPDWCKPDLTVSAHDIPGSGEARTVSTLPGNAYMGTGLNASGLAFSHVSIVGVETQVVTTEGTWDIGKVNDIFVDESGDYAYLATDSNGAEVTIIDLRSTPYVEIGNFDAAGPQDGDAIGYSGNYGYVSQNAELTSFDITQKTGSRPQLDSLSLSTGGHITDIDFAGDYAYLSIQNATTQLVIVDISDPANLVEVAADYVNTYSATSVTVNETGDRVYIGTESNTGDEFFILNTSVKAGPWPILGSFDTGGLSINGLTIVDEYTYAILVGNGSVEYQVIDISNESSLTKCGELDFAYEIHDIASSKDTDGNVFSYAVTGDTANEFRIIRGGQGGGWGSGYGYARDGEYVSSIYDTLSSDTVFYYLNWFETKPLLTNLQVQVRTSNDANMVGSQWTGPDGTSNTYFTDFTGTFLPNSLNFNRYLQFRVIFSGDSILSPTLEEISISYQN